MEIELSKLSSPRIFLVRMLVFLVLCALVMVVLYKQIIMAFFANPGLNALIGGVLLIGIILSFRQVIRLYPEVSWVNNFRIADPGLALERRPKLLAPMAAILGGERSGRMSISQQTMRHLLDSIATRLDEARDISRYMTGLLVFLVLCALVMVVLYKQIMVAFFANPGLNALIGAVLLIGIILSFRQVIRLYPEVAWVNNFRIADPGLAVERHPTLLAPMAAILGGERTGRMTITQQTMRHLLDSIATRLDEARDISRYMTGLLVFLGLLGTFWGLIETVGSVGKVIDGLKVGGDSGALFDTLKEGLAA
ncbi:MAG TPA: hypothetical protein VIM84_02495, partial [Gemmatimonadales bacterium]